MYPSSLQALIDLFSGLPEPERREMLISMADTAPMHEPQPGEQFALEDVRKDEECTDTVGIHLTVEPGGGIRFRVSLGPQVQTLTRAMTSILCQGLNGSDAEEILAVPSDFVPAICGSELVRLRSQTVYYVLSRMKAAVRTWRDRVRAAEAAGGMAS